MSIVFHAERTGQHDLRRGTFRSGARELRTPHFFPVMNIITGPPTPPSPVVANGGIWKWLKRLTLLQDIHVEGADHQPAVPGFLTQVLHFLDYNISPGMLERWLPPGERERIPRFLDEALADIHGPHAAAKRPFLFLDSGGFQLLSTSRIGLSEYGMSTTPENILDLQLRFGCDMLATLDHPVHPGMSDADVKERRERSMNNALWTAENLHHQGIDDKLVFLAVHGRDRAESHDYTRALLRRLAKSPARRVPHGLAIGSLVPLNANPVALLETVRGVMDALRDAPEHDASRIPIHAFGVSSTVAPHLCLLGVDTHDGSSYVHAARNHTYHHSSGSPRKFSTLGELTCTCPGCKLMTRGTLVVEGKALQGLAGVQYALFGARRSHSTYFDWRDGFAETQRVPPHARAQKGAHETWGRGVPKSYFYALLALHNLSGNRRRIARLHDARGDFDDMRAP